MVYGSERQLQNGTRGEQRQDNGVAANEEQVVLYRLNDEACFGARVRETRLVCLLAR